jgi:pimeloyl-ACP methyl ester carboxylesterase
VSERVLKANGVDICAESFGDPADPAVLLIMGATVSMLGWDDEFYRRLAGGARHVIRYDNRDTGRSTTYEPGGPRYTLEDMVGDAVGVLDALGIGRAHLVGMSLGGIITQLAAIEHPERLLTATLIMSTPHGPEDPDLPPMDEKVLAYFQASAALDWSDEAAVVEFMVAGARLLTGPAHRFDEAAAREFAAREMRRAVNFASRMNHGLIASERWRERLREINTPTLLIHGTDDPVLPYGHGVALSKEIRGATLLTLEGTGHELHRDDWDIIIRAVLEHTSAHEADAPAVTH